MRGEPINIQVVRHGDTERTGESPDITEIGRSELEVTANKIARQIHENEYVVFWVSPTARTLDSAKFLLDQLSEKNIKARERIKVVGNLVEKGKTEQRMRSQYPDDTPINLLDTYIENRAPLEIKQTKERQNDFEKRLKRVFYFAAKLTQIEERQNGVPHLIMVTHDVTLSTILLHANLIRKGDEIPTGALISIRIEEGNQRNYYKVLIGYNNKFANLRFSNLDNKIIPNQKVDIVEL